MANWNVCYNWMMDNEDRGRACKIVPDPVSPRITPDMTDKEKEDETEKAKNAQAISGINSYFYPVDFARIAAAPQDQRPPLVQSFYKFVYWNHWMNSLNSDEVAKRVLDAEVNMGEGTGVKLLQRAINSSVNPDAPRIKVDGGWGPATVQAANSVVDAYLVIEFKRYRLNYYQDLVMKDPAKAKYLGTQDHPGGWWVRATA